ncbi:imidazolonepropionase [Aureitalea marina]|uniref:Imidazolonepropionase n=1 Tax=Aureitalea marina TaxID=930804 RepID=A0A2S7KN88_9FLAO|nr:imidazolonepropionase [Aureitalea marina]PQB04099.1 imidazolonepropionase [Aureitalea marina]
MKILLSNIRQLLQVRDEVKQPLRGSQMVELPILEEAWLLLDGDLIADYGSMRLNTLPEADQIVDCTGKFVLPTWCDSHSHLVYAGNREGEFIDRLNGLSYQEIAAKGGGILNSAELLQRTSEKDLYQQSEQRLKEVMALGTGAMEIKSGYGLTEESEMKMLKVARQLEENHPIDIKTTFLGAHAIPKEFNKNGDAYIDHIIKEILPAVAKEELADFIDIFCEEGYFNVAQMESIIQAGQQFGLAAKVHLNQFNSIGGIPAAVRHKALTVDHLEVMKEEDYEALQSGETLAVALPGCSYFLGIPYTPARELIQRNIPLALATDMNPGSAPSGNMNFVLSAACIKMKMTPEEAINASTINGAFAMGLENTHGSITRGKKASVIITKQIPSYGYLPYSFGSDLIHQVLIAGKEIRTNN